MINHNIKHKTGEFREKYTKNVGLKEAESSSQGAFINNVEDSPGGWGLGVKARRGNATRQTKR